MLARLRIQPRVLPRPAAPDPPPHRVSTGHVRPSNGDQDARKPHRSPPRGRQHRLSAIHHPLSAHRHGSTPCVWTRTTLLIPSLQAATPRANSGTALHAEHPPSRDTLGACCGRCFMHAVFLAALAACAQAPLCMPANGDGDGAGSASTGATAASGSVIFFSVRSKICCQSS